MKHKKLLFSLSMLVLAALACALPGGAVEPTSPAIDEVQTAVAATLTAGAPVVNPGVTVDVPTTTPVPAGETPVPPTLAAPAVVCPVVIGFSSTILCVDGPNQTEIANAGPMQVSDVAVSSDGGLVAYTVGLNDGNGNELWLVNSDGSNAHKLLTNDQLPVIQADSFSWPNRFEWRPGTHDLYFDTGWTPNGGVQGPGEYTNVDLWRINADTNEMSNVLSPDAGGRFFFSPDGAWLAVSQPESIDLYHGDGSLAVADAITYELVITYSEYYFKPAVTWGTDGTYFLAVIPSHDPMAPESAATVWRVNTNGNVEPLIVEPGNFLFGGTMVPSPDAQYLAYSTSDNANQWTLHVKKLDGSNAQASEILGDGYIQIYDWSPDSLHFAYSFGDQGLFAGTLNLNPQPLAAVQAVREAVWTDANTVVFSGSLNDHWALRLAALGGAFSDIAGPFGFDMTFDVKR